MDKFNLITDVHQVLYRKTYDGWKISKRKITDYEIVFVTSGKGYIGINDVIYTAETGKVFCFTPSVEHFLETDKKEPMCFYAVHFDFCNYDVNASDWSIVQPFSIPIENISQPNNLYILKDIFKSLNKHWKNKFQGYQLICNSLLQQFIFEVYNSNRFDNISYNVLNKIEEVINYIHNNLNNKISVLKLSEIFGLNYSYLSYVFKQITGYNVTEFINRQKIDRAKELLSEGDMKVKDIAHVVGFEDEFYFSRVFKKIEGISPTKFCYRYVDK